MGKLWQQNNELAFKLYQNKIFAVISQSFLDTYYITSNGNNRNITHVTHINSLPYSNLIVFKQHHFHTKSVYSIGG